MDLHSGLPWWIAKNELYNYFNPLLQDHTVDVAIIGSGITGALVAHELCSAGIKCAIIDKRTIATGSTAASTSQLQYEIDVPLCEMIELVGEANAVEAYKCSLQSITDIEKVFQQTGVDAGFKRLCSLFLASDRKGLKLIEREYEVRKQHGLPVSFLDNKDLKQRYNIDKRGALENDQAAQMDCYKGATGLIKHHMQHSGLQLFSHTEIIEHTAAGTGYTLSTGRGTKVHCKYLVIATGYESKQFLPEDVVELISTYALVSDPVEPSQLWPGRCLLWETAKPYFYLRTTGDNRIMIGGEDENFKDPVRRDKLLPAKVRKLEKKFAALFPKVPFYTDMAWCGTFSTTKDGLPFIGEYPGRKNMFFALGYGGNGITFSMIAAQVICNKIKGISDHREQIFGFER